MLLLPQLQTDIYIYIYDHVGRRLQNYQKINTGAEVQLIDDRYNAIGQLQDRALADRLQSTSLRYNERGWLKSSGSAQFSYELKYQDGAQPQFNGNISAQEWSVASVGSNTFNYKYDNLNRLTSGVATGMSEVLTYDFNGNIKTLKRDAVAVKTYTYIGNRLDSIRTLGVRYVYDGNGNVIKDGRTGLAITYNSLNLPSKVGTVSYIYDASGRKLRKTGDQVTDYVDGIQYTSGAIDVIQTEVGIARRSGTAYSYEYNLTDHLGNVRYTFNKNSSTGALTRVQSDDYYPFGLRKSTGSPVSLNNKYLYNGKELQEEFGQYDYGARFYDPVVGRWNVVDPLAEDYDEFSPYNYTLNNPTNNTDPDGMSVDTPVDIRNDYHFDADGKLNKVVIKPGPDHFYQTDKEGKTSELNSKQLTPDMAGQYLYSSGSLSQDGTLLNEVIINGRRQTSPLPKPTLIEFPSYAGGKALFSGIPRLINMGAELLNGAQTLSQMIAAIANGKSIVYSKGGKKNLYDDEISPLSDSDLVAKKKEAVGKKNNSMLQRIKKEEKRRGTRNVQKRNSN